MYGGAMIDRLVSDWVAQGTSQDSETYSSLRTLRNRSRQLCRDNDYAKNAIRSIRNNVVGTGVRLQSKLKMQRGDTLNKPLNDKIETEFEDWAEAENCHVAGKLSLNEIAYLALGSVATDGEVFIRMVKQPFGESKVPLGLEIIEADQCIETKNGQYGQNTIRMGVELDQWKRPAAYWFYANHPGDMSFAGTAPLREIRVPADEIIHLGVPERVGETRYVPWFHSALRRLHQMEGYEESEVVSARATSSLMGFLETADPIDEDDAASEDGDVIDEFSPGMIKKMAPGEKFTSFNPNRPTGAFDPFMRAMLRGVAAGIGVSYETLSKDYSQSNYSSSRLALLDDRDTWKVLQKWIIAQLYKRVFKTWLQMAVLASVVSIPAFFTAPNDVFRCIRWQPRGWGWIDPEKEVNAYKTAARSGFNSIEQVIEQNGGDFDTTMEQIKSERDYFKKEEIVLDSDPSQVDAKGSAQKAFPSDEGDGDVAPDAAPVPAQTSSVKNPGTNNGGVSASEQAQSQPAKKSAK